MAEDGSWRGFWPKRVRILITVPQFGWIVGPFSSGQLKGGSHGKTYLPVVRNLCELLSCVVSLDWPIRCLQSCGQIQLHQLIGWRRHYDTVTASNFSVTQPLYISPSLSISLTKSPIAMVNLLFWDNLWRNVNTKDIWFTIQQALTRNIIIRKQVGLSFCKSETFCNNLFCENSINVYPIELNLIYDSGLVWALPS